MNLYREIEPAEAAEAVKRVAAIVMGFSGHSVALLLSPDRGAPDASFWRQAVSYLACVELQISQALVSRAMGRTPATISGHLKTVEDARSNQSEEGEALDKTLTLLAGVVRDLVPRGLAYSADQAERRRDVAAEPDAWRQYGGMNQ